ncbi:hypothetical protein LNKW23_04270 [Paralimibaculum aggregatum]|uniref:Uncharacterized protein n=1 Tax=Paralimibaculum aggregatum TaxID=3036245 RepID=A0ABQ6LG84_9RHOB|nr:hypothetical protein LNKW23_04270 [Limibaculum sp. NKW23]
MPDGPRGTFGSLPPLAPDGFAPGNCRAHIPHDCPGGIGPGIPGAFAFDSGDPGAGATGRGSLDGALADGGDGGDVAARFARTGAGTLAAARRRPAAARRDRLGDGAGPAARPGRGSGADPCAPGGRMA